MRRTRVTTTEERELLPLHRPSTSLSLSVGSRPSASPLSPTSPQQQQQLQPPPPRRRSSVTAASPPPAATTFSGYGYKRRESPHDAALADLNVRLTGVSGASVNPPHSRTGGGLTPAAHTKDAPSSERAYTYNPSSDAAGDFAPIAQRQASAATDPSYHRRAARHLSLPPPPRSSSSSAPQYEAIYDPYTGQYRGHLVPPHHSSSSSRHHHHQHMSRPQRQPDSPSASSTTTTASSASSIKTSASSDKEDDYVLGPPPDVNLLLSPEEKKREEDMWATLARIRVIQSEVSKKQLSLEAFAVPSAFPKAGSEDQQQQQQQQGATVSPRGSISRKSGRDTLAGGATSDDPTGSVKGDKRSSKTGVTASPTTTTSPAATAGAGPTDAFAQRREAIDEIVKKLDDLSSAVKQLSTHKQQPPPPQSQSPPQSQPHSPATQPAHPPHQPPTLHIPTSTRPAGGFGWRSPSTSSYNSFKEQFNARNKQRAAQAAGVGGGGSRPTSPPPLQRATTAPTLTVQPPSAISPTSPSSVARPSAYPSAAPQASTPRVLAAPGGYSSASSVGREDQYLASRNRQPLLYDSPASLGEL